MNTTLKVPRNHPVGILFLPVINLVFSGVTGILERVLFVDYDNVPSDEDFLQQLSTELDIPLLLNQGEDELSVLNSLLSGGGTDVLSSNSPLENDLKETQEIRNELKELQVGGNLQIFIQIKSAALATLEELQTKAVKSNGLFCWYLPRRFKKFINFSRQMIFKLEWKC